MKLDPNLIKFKDVYLNDIKRGWTTRAMQQARDYLGYILNDDVKKINQEMDSYAMYLKDVKKHFDQQKKVNHVTKRI